MTISIGNLTDDVSVDVFDIAQLNLMLGALDDRLVEILNNPSPSLQRPDLIRLIVVSQIVHTFRTAAQNPLFLDAAKALVERNISRALQQKGISLTEVAPAMTPNAATPLGALPGLGNTPEKVMDLVQAFFPRAAA